MRNAQANERPILGLFDGFGIEMEYMIVDTEALSVLPITDKVIKAIVGDYVNEVELGELAWSNELALHVIELKTNGPADTLDQLPTLFERDVKRINELLKPWGGQLMPTAMHPWMDPSRETRLWPHSDSSIYQSFDRIFGCQGHGWSNLQSVHLNLPFANDREFAQLHAAIRLVLPILPALAASSPVIEGSLTGLLDNRLDVYRNNARRIPSISGQIIPEPVYTRRDYEIGILQPIYRDLEPHDPTGILMYEWVNARGAIARFDRNTIELRTLDIQECPQADLAIAAAVVQVIKAHTEQTWASLAAQKAWEVTALYEIFLHCVSDAERAVISNRKYLDIFAYPERGRCRAGELWQHLIETTWGDARESAAVWQGAWDTLIGKGTLARRIVTALGNEPTRDTLRNVYLTLCDCLATGKLFGT